MIDVRDEMTGIGFEQNIPMSHQFWNPTEVQARKQHVLVLPFRLTVPAEETANASIDSPTAMTINSQMLILPPRRNIPVKAAGIKKDPPSPR
jgi:hypothetical protein